MEWQIFDYMQIFFSLQLPYNLIETLIILSCNVAAKVYSDFFIDSIKMYGYIVKFVL